MIDKKKLKEDRNKSLESLNRRFDYELDELRNYIDKFILYYNNLGETSCDDVLIYEYSLLAAFNYSDGKYEWRNINNCWKDFFSELLAPYVDNGYHVSVYRKYGAMYRGESDRYLMGFSWGDDTEGGIDFTESNYNDTREKFWIKRVWKNIFA